MFEILSILIIVILIVSNLITYIYYDTERIRSQRYKHEYYKALDVIKDLNKVNTVLIENKKNIGGSGGEEYGDLH